MAQFKVEDFSEIISRPLEVSKVLQSPVNDLRVFYRQAGKVTSQTDKTIRQMIRLQTEYVAVIQRGATEKILRDAERMASEILAAAEEVQISQQKGTLAEQQLLRRVARLTPRQRQGVRSQIDKIRRTQFRLIKVLLQTAENLRSHSPTAIELGSPRMSTVAPPDPWPPQIENE